MRQSMSPGDRPDNEEPEDLVFLTPLPTDEADDEEPIHAVPAVIDIDDVASRPNRRPINIGGGDEEDYEDKNVISLPLGNLDISDLLNAFDAQRRNAPGGGDDDDLMDEPLEASEQPIALNPLPDRKDHEITRLRNELEMEQSFSRRLHSDLESERSSARRLQADLVNNRRKAEQERERAVRETADRLVKQLFPIMDDFERSLATSNGLQNYDTLVAGVGAILRNFTTLLAKQGIEPVPTVGTMFDPDLHEAVAVEETEDQPDETVIAELRKGYIRDGRLLRAAMVKVARHIGETKPVEESQPDTDEELPQNSDEE